MYLPVLLLTKNVPVDGYYYYYCYVICKGNNDVRTKLNPDLQYGGIILLIYFSFQ